MPILSKIQKVLSPRFFDDADNIKEKTLQYRRLRTYLIVLTSVVAIAPLTILTILNIYQSKKAITQEVVQPTETLASNAKRSLEINFQERQSALKFIINEMSYNELTNQESLSRIFLNMKQSFGGIIDLGLIDSKGIQQSYAGPYDLFGKNYSDQDWFNGVKLNDFYISDVFMGFRGFPHFVLAVKKDLPDGDFYLLRTTIDIEFINNQIRILHLNPASDAFLINKKGILQTKSHFYGDILKKWEIPVPRYSSGTEILEFRDEDNQQGLMGYAYIEQSPFLFIIVKHPKELFKNLVALRTDLFIFFIISVALILLVTVWVTSDLINRLQTANIKHTKVLHNLEYTNKMASIGRLAAGVAHEINNPLAIINQKAGLIKDIVSFDENMPNRNKFIEIVNSILNSVDRCSTITHRLLGFAKRMDLKIEPIDLQKLIEEVLGFLGKELVIRNIDISFDFEEPSTIIQSDKGQLQQVFLNIINNALAASEEGDKILISIRNEGIEHVLVTFTDYGRGIEEEDLLHIFEPFFTTKEEGTGLGLSITYGIIKKMGGDIQVTSKVGEGTSFMVKLPRNSHSYKEF